MLILNRNMDENIRIGNDIVIRVLDRRGNQVRLGIEAPKHITVHREEVYQKIISANNVGVDIADE